MSLTIKTINFVNIIHLSKKKIQFFVQKNVIFVLKNWTNLEKLMDDLSKETLKKVHGC